MNAKNIMTFRPFRSFKRFLPQSLFGRSLIILLTPLILVQVILGYVFFDRHTETILRTLSQTIAGDIALVLAWHETIDAPLPYTIQSGTIHPQASFDQLKRLAKENLALDLTFDPHKKLDRTGQYRESWLYTPLIIALNEKVREPYYVRITPDYILLDIQLKKGVMQVSLLRKRFFSRTTPLVLIWTTVSALILFGVASIFMRNQIRPITRLAQAASQFGKGDESITFKPEGALEVRKAGFAFIRMRDRLKRLLQERLEMLAGVSHDLRTPITRLKLSVVMLPEGAKRQQIEDDVAMLHHMVEGFLSYARGTTEEESMYVNLVQWIHNIVALHHLIPIKVQGDHNVKIKIKRTLLNRCLTNLIVNSEKNAKNLVIEIKRLGTSVIITLDDDGTGIPESEREHVFKPFYRLDQARNLDKVGVGLGLSVAREAVLTHGGQIDLLTSPMGGLRVHIRLPIDT